MLSIWFVLAGLGLNRLGVWQYVDLTAFDAAGGRREPPWLLAGLYSDRGGKWPVVIFPSGIGGLMTITGLATLLRSRSSAA